VLGNELERHDTESVQHLCINADLTESLGCRKTLGSQMTFLTGGLNTVFIFLVFVSTPRLSSGCSLDIWIRSCRHRRSKQ
jgi:hypothetical protein